MTKSEPRVSRLTNSLSFRTFSTREVSPPDPKSSNICPQPFISVRESLKPGSEWPEPPNQRNIQSRKDTEPSSFFRSYVRKAYAFKRQRVKIVPKLGCNRIINYSSIVRNHTGLVNKRNKRLCDHES